MIEINIKTDKSFTRENLLNMIVTDNKSALKNLVDEIYTVINTNWDTYDYISRIMKALEAANFQESDEFKYLEESHQNIYDINMKHASLRKAAEKALEKLS